MVDSRRENQKTFLKISRSSFLLIRVATDMNTLSAARNYANNILKTLAGKQQKTIDKIKERLWA